tara:strand:+ start:464 stop:682 length:219 start_codon:yes stop_codon:yes gene_type:complete
MSHGVIKFVDLSEEDFPFISMGHAFKVAKSQVNCPYGAPTCHPLKERVMESGTVKTNPDNCPYGVPSVHVQG